MAIRVTMPVKQSAALYFSAKEGIRMKKKKVLAPIAASPNEVMLYTRSC